MKKIIRMTESDLHNIVNGSVKKILREWTRSVGYVPNNGNSMVGGYYGGGECMASKNIFDDFFDNIPTDMVNDEELDELYAYCSRHKELFTIEARIGLSYDESVGYGRSDAPMAEIESIDGGEEVKQYLLAFPNQRVGEIAAEVLDNVIEGLDTDDFDYEV